MALFNHPLREKATSEPARIHVEDPNALEKFSRAFSHKLAKFHLTDNRPKIIVCIGTDRSTGDCLGPLIGSKLQEASSHPFHVFGNLDQPVHATNLKEYLQVIDESFVNPFVIAIDACLGSVNNVGYVNLGEGSIRPGAGVNKELPEVGNIHITGIVNVGGFMEYFVLQNTRLNIVMKMANLITAGIIKGSYEYKNTQLY